jgi:hypothetical protein
VKKRAAAHPAVETRIEFITAMNRWERGLTASNFKSLADLTGGGRSSTSRA